MRFLLIVSSLLCFRFAIAQQLNGVWQGVLTQPTSKQALASSYSFWMQIDIKENNQIDGFARIELPLTQNFVVWSIQGSIKGSNLLINDIHIVSEYIENDSLEWCKKSFVLTYNKATHMMQGKWKGDDCGIGNIEQLKSNLPFNFEKPKIKKVVTLNEMKTSTNLDDSKIIFQHIQFNTGSAKLLPQSIATLNEVVDFMKKNRDIKIKITGHTDNRGNINGHFILSVQRAESVSQYFIKNGIQKERIITEGYGSSKPLVPNDSEMNMQKNRRIEFEIIY